MEKERNSFLLQYGQPGLLGLMDGSVSTLAPLYASAFATNSAHIAFIIGLSAAVGAAISMGFAEALSDSGKHTGRGHPFSRGIVTGAMTFIGGILHTLPFFFGSIKQAVFVSYVIVLLELIVIAYIRRHFFGMNFFLSATQVVVGGIFVALSGIIIGSS